MLLAGIVEARPPDLDVEDDWGFRHCLWKIPDRGAQDKLNEALLPRTFYIADGHHRFQTAVQFMQECREKGWRPEGVESFDKRMMALFNMESPGLRILPTHRAVRDLASFDIQRLLSVLKNEFEVKPLPSLDSLRGSLQHNPRTIGMLSGSSLDAWSIRPRSKMPSSLQNLPQSSATLDVNLLHLAILEPFLGIGTKELAAQSHVDYFRDAERLAEDIRSGIYQLGFLLSPTTLEQVRRCSDDGLMMPQKSTDFFPKLLTGLVFSQMGIIKNPQGE